MICQPQHRGLTIIELLAVVAVVVCLMAAALPVIGKVRTDSGIEGSINNLVTLSVAHVLYAADFNSRQLTWVADDLAAFGSVGGYNSRHYCSYSDGSCHPSIFWGWTCEGYLYRWLIETGGHHWAVQPLNFLGGAARFGNFRFINAQAFHQYVNGRAYDSTFYAPNDSAPYEAAAPFFEEPCEYPFEAIPPLWSSYSLSPAAMFHPDVMRSNAAGGWQSPWSFVQGFASPGLFQALYPDLKTHMIEHHWVQSPPVDCNPAIDSFGSGVYDGCEPYYFNHGLASSPVALFYDGHVRLLPNTEVLAADRQILKQTGGVDGLWHRGTPFGKDGYFISVGFDGVPLSHHILTTDGILGRDTLGGSQPPPPIAAGKSGRRASRLRRAAPNLEQGSTGQ